MTDQIIDQWYTVHMMGVPLDYRSYAFSNNHAIIQQSIIPKSKLMTSSNMLGFHCVQETITSGFLQLFQNPGT